MSKIKRSDIRYKEWIKHRNKKNLKKRTYLKRKNKNKKANIIKYNTEIKKVIPYDKRTHNHRFSAPLDFSFISNTEKTATFFYNILSFISNDNNLGKRIFIDISQVEHLTIDALMYLLAIVNNLNDNFKNKNRISGNSPLNAEINRIFKESGFHNYVKFNNKESLTKSSDSMQIVSGKSCDTKIAKQITDFVISKSKLTKQECNFIYIMLIEMMSNTQKHAYNDRGFLLPQWYCFVEYDKKETISFTFMDTGLGIPNTVRKKKFEYIREKFTEYEDKYVISALKGEFRTSTEELYRGKGLPKIKEFCDDKKIQNMRIITSKADVSVKPNDIKSKTIDNPLQGTLFYWELQI